MVLYLEVMGERTVLDIAPSLEHILFLELQINKAIDIQLVQSNEVPNSNHMELEGFKRSILLLEDNELEIKLVVTDRHRMMGKWIRENLPHVRHLFDIWHVAK
ncbi:hypothetical protein QZH41_017515, partial [Actinostola sp. cb2023]